MVIEVIAFAVPVCWLESTRLPLRIVANTGVPAVVVIFCAIVASESPAAMLTSVVPAAEVMWMTSAAAAVVAPLAVNWLARASWVTPTS